MVEAIQSPKDYQLTAIITADRISGRQIDISLNIVELTIFERMDMPYLTAQMLIKDDADIYNSVNISGTEKISLTIQQPTSDRVIEKDFIIERVERIRKVNDNVEMIMLRLIQDHGYNDQLNRFSKAFTGKPELIIQKIITDQFGLLVDSYARPSAQQEIRFVVPYLTPLQAVETVRSRATTENGSPYFLYAALNSKNIILKDLDTIFKQTAWNEELPTKRPFIFSTLQANAVENTVDQFTKQLYNIQSFVYKETDDTLAMAKHGAIGSLNSYTDATSGITLSSHFDVKTLIDKLNTSVLPPSKELKLDLKYLFKGDTINYYNGAVPHKIVANNTYPDKANIYQERDIGKFLLDSYADALHQLIFKNVVELSLPGLHFITGQNKSVGQIINVFFMSSDVTKITNPNIAFEEVKDKKKSGDYMIYSMRHSFTLGKHNVVAEAVKLRYEKGE